MLGTSLGIVSPFARIGVECNLSRAQYVRVDFGPDSNVLEYSATAEGGGWQRGIRAAHNSAWIQRRQ
jgi:hypothetical protein